MGKSLKRTWEWKKNIQTFKTHKQLLLEIQKILEKMTENYKIGSLDPEEDIKGFTFEAKRPTYSYILAIHSWDPDLSFYCGLKGYVKKGASLKNFSK